jgi:hypothetical protein
MTSPIAGIYKEETVVECNKEKNLTHCKCTYDPCPRKGICCECIAYHLRSRELPPVPLPCERT